MTESMIVLDPLTESPLKNLSGFDSAFSNEGYDPIAVFDFDGVLCAPTEDLVYKLKETDGERSFLQKMATDHGIDHSLYDVPYLRHLVLQAILDLQCVLPQPGPMLPLALELSKKNRPFFVLTARSGRSAVNRALNFWDLYT